MAGHFPDSEKFGLRAQMTRSAVSIPSNIVEGSAKKSGKDYKRFAEIALGSAFELETHVLIVKQQKWVPVDKVERILQID